MWGMPSGPRCIPQAGHEPAQSLPTDFTFGPGFDQVMGDGNRRWHAQVWMLTPEGGEDVSAGEPAHIGHLFVVDVDING